MTLQSTFIQETEQECKDNGIEFSDTIKSELKTEWFSNLVEYLNKGNKVSNEIIEELDDSQKWYINKHFSIHGVEVVKCI